MSGLSIELLGPPRVTHGGRTLKFRSRKELCLLLFLAAERGPHSRLKLANLFWPRSTEKAGRAALRNALAGLQRTIRESAGEPDDSHIIVERDSLAFDFASDFDLDLDAIEGKRSDIPALQAAVEAYRGDFLEGFNVDGSPDLELWMDGERARWRTRIEAVYERLSRLQMESGEAPEACETASIWVSRSPSNETATQRLMEARLAAGDRDGAMRAYEEYRSIGDAGPEMEALAMRARSGGRGVRSEPGIRRGSPELPLVGRSEEFGVLVSEYRWAREGQTRVVAIIGEAGIGKTRLSNEFLEWAAAHGADVLRGRAYEAGGGLAYGMVANALRARIERERAPDDLLPDVWLSEISRLLPELGERYPDLPIPSSDEASARARLFEAVARLGEALADPAPVVFFFDDFHRADLASLDVLRYACGRWAEDGSPILLVACLRSESLASEPALAGWLSDLARDLPVERVPLGPLTENDTEDIARSLAPKEADATKRFGRWLYGETGGQPFYVVEMIRTLFEEGVLVDGEGVEIARDPEEMGNLLPSRVREVVRARVERLGGAAKELLTAGAVLGDVFSFEELYRVAEVGEGAALDALDEALGSHLLRETPGSGYAFAHDKIGEVVYTEAGDARRRVLHRRALPILAGEGSPPATLARHAFAAGLANLAFRHSIAAGDGAMELFAAKDAISHYERARGLLADGRDTEVPAEGIEHLYVNLGRALEILGEWDEAETTYEEMLAHAREERKPSLEWAALSRMAILRGQRFFDMEAALSLTRKALEVATSSGNKTAIAETEWNLTQMAALGWKMEETFDHGEKALSLAREEGLAELEARTLYILGIACLILGRFEETVHRAGRAAELYAAVDSREMRSGALAAQFVWAGSPPSGPLANRAMEVFCLAVLTLGEINRGEPRRAVEAGRKAYETGRSINNEWTRVFGGACLAHGHIELGEYGEAIRVCHEILEGARSLPNPIACLFTLFPLIDAYEGIRSLEEARKACLEALSLSESASVRPYRHIIVSRMCANHALAEEWEEAHKYALESSAARNETPVSLTRMDFVRHHETEALLRAGDEEHAREDVRVIGEHVGGNRRFRLVHLRASAAIFRWDGEADAAIERLTEAALLADEMELSGESWQIRADLGEVYERSDRISEAARTYAKAAETISTIADGLDEDSRDRFLASPEARRVTGSVVG